MYVIYVLLSRLLFFLIRDIHLPIHPSPAPTQSPHVFTLSQPFTHLAASAFIPCCTQARLFSACSFIFAGSLLNSFMRCGSGTCRPFSTPGRCNMRSSHAFRAGNSSMLTPDQKAPVTQLNKEREKDQFNSVRGKEGKKGKGGKGGIRRTPNARYLQWCIYHRLDTRTLISRAECLGRRISASSRSRSGSLRTRSFLARTG